MSGYDKNGKLFWLPIYEDDAVLQSAASNVLGQVYRYVESGSCMEATAASIMTNEPAPLPLAPSLRARDAPPLTLPPGLRGAGGALGDGNGGGRGTDDGRGGGMDGAAGLVGTAGGAGRAPVGAQGATVPPAGAVGGAAGGMTAVDAQLAAAQAAAAAIVDGEDEEITPSAVAPPEAPGAASAAATSAHRTFQGLSIADRGASGALDPRPSSGCGAIGRSLLHRPPTPRRTSYLPTPP